MQDVAYELGRIPLIGRWVNKGKKKGQDIDNLALG